MLYLDDAMLEACGCTHNDTEGLINLPLTAREIQAVVFFKVAPDGDVRVSMRSKYDVDVRLVANAFGGGGHKNAAGFTVDGPVDRSATASRGEDGHCRGCAGAADVDRVESGSVDAAGIGASCEPAGLADHGPDRA